MRENGRPEEYGLHGNLICLICHKKIVSREKNDKIRNTCLQNILCLYPINSMLIGFKRYVYWG